MTNILTKVVVAVAVTVTLLIGVPLAWDFWKWRTAPPPKEDRVVLDEASRKCTLAEMAKGAKDRDGMIGVLAVIKNRKGEMKANHSVCDDFRGYVLVRAPSQGRVSTSVLKQAGRLLIGKPVQVRDPDFVNDLQGQRGFGGMPERVALARTILTDLEKNPSGVLDERARPYLGCIVRFVPHREDYWYDNVGGMDFEALKRDGLELVFTSPGGTRFYCLQKRG